MDLIKLLIGLAAFVNAQTFAIEVYFSPSPDCEKRIVRAIDDSKTEIVAAVYMPSQML